MINYFEPWEFACSCKKCSGLPEGGMDKRLIDVLNKMRAKIGQPVLITSGYRCPEYNAEVGGVPNSQHVLGTAVDITFPNIDCDAVADLAEECGADGIGKYPDQEFVHIDTRGEVARWDG